MLHALFGFTGRISRKPFWLYSILMIIVLVLAVLALGIIISIINPGLSDEQIEIRLRVPTIVLTLATLWPTLALTIKRLYDRSRPAWLAMPMVVPTYLHTIAAHASGSTDVFPMHTPLLAVLGVAALAATLWAVIDLGLLRGTIGPNRHGPDPLAAEQ